jgi:hypothetical protein
MRADHSSAFNAREFRELQVIEPIVRAAAARRWSELFRRFAQEGASGGETNLQRHLDYASRTFGRSVLTPRESRASCSRASFRL